MKQKQDILHSLIIEVTMVLLASMIAFQVCNMLGIRMSLIPLVMVIGYVIQKLLHHLCIILARYLVDAIPPSLLISVKKCVSKKTQPLAYSPTSNNEEVQKKRLELFHYEYQREQQQYQWQKEREEDEKLNAILRYTRDTFKRFDLEEIEIYQICESVRYFAINRQAFCADSVGGMFGLYFLPSVPHGFADVMKSDTETFNRFFHGMLERGVYFAPSVFEAGFVSIMHTDEVIDATIAAARETFAEIAA